MNSLVVIMVLAGVAAAAPQYEAGFVKILSDQRYQEGALFGNHREQEDGIKYHEEVDANNIRRGYYEYPSSDGRILRTEFEAGPGIGYRVVKSNHQDPTPVASAPSVPAQPRQAPVIVAPIPQAPVAPRTTTTTTPPPPQFQNLFDYPANLDFNRHSQGHRFKFTAV